ncbi:uncharacterized protein LOC103711787 [Phoenix dactylifera]|uniref:Uncharacterized protein LOC103711787 n=1 Tax=Phoenix dactylifera TaxID=42345 RepID=A0A8B7CCF5_PHODC|nr:uncharacterized protein LOC103711787 [Phoenix dactylifera]
MEEEGDNKEKIVKIASAEEGADEEDDCYEIDPIDFARKLTINDSDDIVIVAEKGPVALKDFPHPRHLCGNFPFHSTSHESYCNKCFCYVCETSAPCQHWRGIDGHCHVSKKHEEFQELGETVKDRSSYVKEE